MEVSSNLSFSTIYPSFPILKGKVNNHFPLFPEKSKVIRVTGCCVPEEGGMYLFQGGASALLIYNPPNVYN